MQLEFQIPQIPKANGTITRGSEKDELGGGVEGEGVDGLSVGFYGCWRLGGTRGADVMNLEG
jgi:hypothetical protein